MTKSKVFLIIIGLFVFFILFYWFQIRPSVIVSRCNTLSLKGAIEVAPTYLKKDMGFENKTYERFYERCLRKEGLK